MGKQVVNLTEISNQQWTSIGLDNGLAPSVIEVDSKMKTTSTN